MTRRRPSHPFMGTWKFAKQPHIRLLVFYEIYIYAVVSINITMTLRQWWYIYRYTYIGSNYTITVHQVRVEDR